MEMFSLLGLVILCCVVVFGFACLIIDKASRRTTLYWLIPLTLMAVLGVFGWGKYLLLDEPLYMAASNGNVTEVTRLLSRGASANSDFEGIPALSAAVEGGHADVVKVLLKHGARHDVVNWTTGSSPLHAARANGYTVIERLLIEAGATK